VAERFRLIGLGDTHFMPLKPDNRICKVAGKAKLMATEATPKIRPRPAAMRLVLSREQEIRATVHEGQAAFSVSFDSFKNI
jgi:hypothetical protein